MTKKALKMLVRAFNREMRDVLQMIYDTLNVGQRKQLLKNDEVRKKFKQYQVEFEENGEAAE